MSNTENLAIFSKLSEEEQTRLLADHARTRSPLGSIDTSDQIVSLRPQPLADLLSQDIPPLDFLVDGLLAKGNFVVLGGRPKSGKSWLTLQLAKAIDGGSAFLGKTAHQARCLFVALEDGSRRIHQRAKLLNWQPNQARVVFELAHFDGANGNTGPGIEQIARLAPEYDLIIIDTLIRALSGRANENDNAQMGFIVNGLAEIAHTHDTCVLVVHHTGKGAAENPFDLLRGASAIRGGYDVGMVLERRQSEREAILYIESRDFDSADLTIRQAEQGAGWDALGAGHEIHRIRAGRRAVQALIEIGAGATTNDIAEHLEIDRSAALRQLANAERDGHIRRQSLRAGVGSKPTDTWHLVE